jgi:replication-associated recombination protein RarA
MIEGGEDVKFIARRMLILSSEDIEIYASLWLIILFRQSAQ